MSTITYLTGNATYPIGEGTKFICHICNDIGGWGRGFVTAISRRWPEPEQAYRTLASECITNYGKMELGNFQPVKVADDIVVINLIAQHNIKTIDGVPPIRYDKLRIALSTFVRYTYPGERINLFANHLKMSIVNPSFHMPRIGCGLAGGTWDKIEPIIESTLGCVGYPIFVYDLP